VKLKLFLLAFLAFVAVLALVAPDAAQAQTVLNDSLHPRTYGWAVRAPWYNGVATARIVKSDTVAKSDTLTILGVTSTTKVWYSRLVPPKKAASDPIITVTTGKIIIAFGVADTCTYHLLIDKKSN
jgi:hypothetical protein